MKTADQLETDIWFEDFVTQLLELARLDLQLEELEVDEETRTFTAQLDGPDKAAAIGRDGQVLEALQHLAVAAGANAGVGRDRLVVDVDGYRRRRDEKLREDASHWARETASSGVPYDFEPMSPRDRRLVHMMISQVEGVESESIGYGEDRYVRVVPSAS